MALLQGICTSASDAESIGVVVRQGFLDGVQSQQVQSLDRSIDHNGDP
jgi:hypothetical protein